MESLPEIRLSISTYIPVVNPWSYQAIFHAFDTLPLSQRNHPPTWRSSGFPSCKIVSDKLVIAHQDG
jgi:hypothetical protein